MEIKNVLNKPFSKIDRLNFIVEQNHQFGYEIIETNTSLEAWGKTKAELQEFEKEKQKTKIQQQIDELDKKRIRAVCEPSMKTNSQSWLDYYNEEIKKLRELL